MRFLIIGLAMVLAPGCNPTGDSAALHEQIRKGNLERVRQLLERDGTLLLAKETVYGDFPLHTAARNDQLSVVDLLLSLGADVTGRNKRNETPLLLSRPDIAEVLLKKGADPDARNQEGNTRLHNAAGIGDIATVKLLVARKANLNGLNSEQETPLRLAASGLKTEIIELLLKSGAQLDPVVACIIGDKKFLLQAIEKDRAVATKAYGTRTLLHVAAFEGKSEIVRILLDHGADPNCRNDSGRAPLQSAFSGGHIGIVKLLVKKTDINIADKKGRTALHDALNMERYAIAELLLDHKAEVNTQDELGFTPLHTAASCNARLVELLLAKGARVDVRNKYGDTPAEVPGIKPGVRDLLSRQKLK